MLASCHRFELDLDREIAEHVEPFEGGVAVINTRVPLIWTANYLLLDPGRLPDAETVEGLVSEHLSSPGMDHGAIETVEAGDNEELAEALSGRNWDRDRTLYMVPRRRPDREPGTPAEEVPQAAIEALRREVATDMERSSGVVDQMLERDRMLDSVADGRWFAAMHQGKPGSCCVLFSRGGIGRSRP